ncbi:MAG: hypothetical protein D8M58_11435 [Calditrichaeota bacterium]|nr:MAG: hypothetical protein DWQ03_10810 [Calditrichota bacterium]MBL1206006.1 hypothetical protein [Calditrichota bacterium]NOG45834.1 hypothetical protein [Calditrichota bacterium]
MSSKLIFTTTFLLFLIMVLCSCQNYSQEKQQDIKNPTFLGTWEMQSIHWITKDTTFSIEKAQPGMLILTADSYSIMWTPTDVPRVPFQNLSQPTDPEILSGFKSIVFNCGDYRYSDSTITTTAKIAKVPGFEGGKQFYRFKIENNKMDLTMFDEIYPDGTRPAWYGRFQTKFVLKKVDQSTR